MSASITGTLKNAIQALDDTAWIYEVELPTNAVMVSNPDLISLGVGVKEYGVILATLDAINGASSEQVGVIYEDEEYAADFATIFSTSVGGTITFTAGGK